jgi:fatty acid desaturase
MSAAWQRCEGPTWLVAVAIYGGWIGLALLHQHVPLVLALPLAVYLTAWHSSLQHETIHALRRVPRSLKNALGLPPLGIWFPYELYRREHERHHATAELAAPHDPESFYHDPASWARMGAPLRALFVANQTLAGRMILGPALQIGRVYANEGRQLLRGDRSNAGLWILHGALLAALATFLWRSGVNPFWYAAFVAYPAASLGLMRSFAEHRFDGSPRERTVTVESRGLLSLLFLNNNLHVAHHAHPSLPWYELPRRHRRVHAQRGSVPALRGYRSVIRTWLLRPIDFPVAPANDGTRGQALQLKSAR